ncbi:hypothetical protein NM208_g16165 [Fusarium decemcellulare]|uniref:Uncharacterized protein n=1 Tax=Fusarium decemcellulare TaxID=57161 RepID=A0ACC1RC87_9HYPO|nr:hypothetical protein NM208_g16165 [Fusarium decemcellulare]
MPPANSKANYKTYEAQARMVRAIVAAHPEVKWNYKEIVNCYGSDMTEHALNHRFRRVRAAAQIIPLAREQGLDVKDLSTDENILPATQGGIDKNSTIPSALSPCPLPLCPGPRVVNRLLQSSLFLF